jgi:uncharacterized protein (DUF362 family)
MSVAIVKNFNSLEGTGEVLSLIDDEIKTVVGSRRKFLIKPNFVSAYNYLAVTPVETVEAVLQYLYKRFDISEILIAETPTIGSMETAIRNFGYDKLKNRYAVEFVDLEDYDYERISLVDEHGHDYDVYVSKLLFDKSFVRISVCRAKTHDYVVVTLSIKNVVVGSIRKGMRYEIHRGYLSINYAIAKLATYLMPDLGVVDGVEGMEGNGPVSGIPKRWGAIFASTNPVNLDVVVTYAMGFDPKDVGYLYILSMWNYGEIDVNKIKVIGESIENVRTKFKPHSTYREQLSWKKYMNKLREYILHR